MTGYAMSKHARERMAERRIRDAWVARALCQSPTYDTRRRIAQYFDPRTKTVVIADTVARLVRTVYIAGTRS